MNGTVAWRAVLTAVSFLVPYIMLGSRLEERDGITWRRVVAALCTVTSTVICASTGVMEGHGELTSSNISTLLMFCGVLLMATALIYLCRTCSIWFALFCAVFGYAMQNTSQSALYLVAAPIILRRISLGEPLLSILLILTSAVTYVVCYQLFVSRIPKGGVTDIGRRLVLVLVVVVVTLNIFASSAVRSLEYGGVDWMVYLALVISHTISCLLLLFFEFEVLVNHRLVTEAAVNRHAMEERERQYESARTSIEAVNARMHDMRHTVANLLTGDLAHGEASRGSLRRIIRELSVYDASVHTGNPPLDTALTEKRLICEREHVTLTFMADGHSLDEVAPSDVYALFAGLLDEALAAVSPLEEGERSISLTVKRSHDMVSIHLEHRAAAEEVAVHSAIVQTVVSRLDGVISRGAEGGVRYVNILVPIT